VSENKKTKRRLCSSEKPTFRPAGRTSPSQSPSLLPRVSLQNIIFFLFTDTLPILSSHERQKPDIPRMLDRQGELTLAFSADAGFLTADDTGMRVQESFDDFCVLIIDMFNVVLTKVALFFHVFCNDFYNLFCLTLICFRLSTKTECRRD
jgi:hypothetical protein